MAAKVQTDSVNVLELAKRGDPGAIASLLTRALQPKGIKVQVVQEGDCLLLSLEGMQVPDQHTLLPFLTKGMTHLGVESIRRLKIDGQQVGQTTPDWQQEVALGKPPVVVLDTLQDAPYGGGAVGKRGASSDPSSPLPAGGAATAVASTVVEEASAYPGATGQPIGIGERMVQMTNQGGLVNLAAAQGRAVLRDRPVPTPDRYCQPMAQLLDRRLETEEAIATLQRGFSVEFFGEQGMGKTALLRSLAHHPQINAAFRDGIVYRLVRQQPVTDLIQSIFNDFFEYDGAIATKPTEAEINVALRGKRALVVLDDVQLAPEAIEFLHSLPGLTFLLAGPQRYVWGDINAMPMLGLPLNDALVLLETALGRAIASTERSQAEALCNQLRGHPLRILQAAALMQQERISPVALTQMVRDSTYASPLTLKAAASLAEPERQVLAVLAALDGFPIGIEHLVALSGIQQIQPVLATLMQRSLVLTDGSRYYLTGSGVESLRQIWDLSQWNQRVLTYIVTWAEQRQDNLDELQQDIEVLLYAARLALETGQWAQVLRLAYLMDRALFASGQWGAWEQLWQWALQAGRSLRNQSAIAYALHQLGTRALCVDDPFTAHTFLIEALQIRDALDETAGLAVTRHNLGLLLATPVTAAEPASVEASPVMAAVPPVNRSGLVKGLLIGGLVAVAAGAIAMLLPSIFAKPASFSLSSTRLGFGGQSINITSDEQSIRLVNTGTQPLVISSITPSGEDVSDFQVMDDCTTAPIPPGEDCTIRITFTPQAEGNRLATITILDKNGDQPEELLISGIGEPPATPLILSFAPGTLSFTKQVAGSQSQPQSINVTNTGSVPITIDRLGLTGDQAGDFQTTSTCQGVTLDPKETCTVRVVFLPKKEASSRAVLVITARNEAPSASSSDADPLPAKPAPFWNIPLNGEGIARPSQPFWRNPFGGGSSEGPQGQPPSSYGNPDYAPPVSGGVAKLSLSSPELNFGQLAPGSNREKTLVIANTGSGTLRIDEIYIMGEQAGAFEIVDNTCVGRSIAPDGGCTITFRVTASGSGDRTATLRITDNAADSPDAVPMSARVGASQPSPAPSPTGERPAAERPTIERFTASPSEITAGESANLCYSVNHANSVAIAGVGNVPPSADNCVVVNPSQSTIYRITAVGSGGQQATGETTVRVTQADAGPPASPQSLSPGSATRSQAPDLLSCKNSTPLRWQAAAAGSRPASYELTLQYLSEDQQQWVTVFDGAASPGTDATPWLVQSGNYWWRWTVRSLDANGRASDAAPWRYFSCFDFT